jgi:hypothetical protein
MLGVTRVCGGCAGAQRPSPHLNFLLDFDEALLLVQEDLIVLQNRVL